MGRKKTGRSDKVKQLYESGSSIEEIAQELNYKISSVETILGRKGVKRRKYAKDYAAVISDMACQGKSIQEISRTIGISAYSISEYMHQCGIRRETRQAISKEMIEKSLENLQFAQKREPTVKHMEYKGKHWQDVTDWYLGG